ncbi:diacylglycerol O-acyltransferase 2-like protein 6 isoform X2 [Erinaceus europaeus]|uniref:Acyltransferase n=1 Tax=Erinaceus europaeus TaxID=9365 RepID=A0ABM3WQJ0_ERIEU|nr:diacylglycerol O-acyltransferase 2-like protein 6 isoform X2 [Erinaceus europaeus]
MMFWCMSFWIQEFRCVCTKKVFVNFEHCSGLTSTILITYGLVCTKFWILSVLVLAWHAYDWNTYQEGGRRSAWVRNWTLWKYFQKYFPVKLVKTHDLSPKHNYLIANHPHGIFSFGAFINFATEATGFDRIFPNITPYLGTIRWFFWFPILRDYMMSVGVCPVSETTLKYLLSQKHTSNAVVVVVGGGAEALLCHPGASTVFLKHRKGFVKLALQTGAHLVPTYSFGENETYNQETFPEGTWKRFFQKKFQEIFKKHLRLYLCTFHGRGLTRESWGFLPFNHPITTVVGEPLPIPMIQNPDKETVDKYHTLYINALCKLFDEYKIQYGLPQTQKLTII